MKTALGEAIHGGSQDLLPTIGVGFYFDGSHEVGKLNERSFIVNRRSELSDALDRHHARGPYSLMAKRSALQAPWSEVVLRGFSPNKRYLVGVSGGRDSIALLNWLAEAGYRKLTVCHLNHSLRGRASRTDAKFVQRITERFGFDFESETVDVSAYARAKKVSLETAARQVRYQFFAKVARRRRCRLIFLGHHADDLVETFLLNLFRGAGLSGLASIRELSTRKISGLELQILRPLLRVWRNQIDAYIRARRLKFREDATNRELAATRNRIRLRIIPYLEKQFGREIRKSIWRTAMIAADENAWMNDLLPMIKKDLPTKILRAQPLAAQRRLIHSWLQKSKISDVGFDLIERIRLLSEIESPNAKTNLPRGLHVRRRAKLLFIEG